MENHFIYHPYDYPHDHIQLGYPPDPLYYHPPPFESDYLFSDSPPTMFDAPPFGEPIIDAQVMPSLSTRPATVAKRPKSATKRSDKTKEKKKCMNCGATKTPTWRRGPFTRWLLCNACGLYEKVSRRRRVVTVHPDGKTKISRGAHDDPKVSTMTCSMCSTNNANRWHIRGKLTLCERCVRSKL
ncbi:hypothetical protein BJV82DRAFT_180408 [Fennellomyces sp. T-0311]|nr:hypothetical protein BJV82DRAFT_180408 [Fennellomyces sp. T-0311]